MNSEKSHFYGKESALDHIFHDTSSYTIYCKAGKTTILNHKWTWGTYQLIHSWSAWLSLPDLSLHREKYFKNQQHFLTC